VERPVRFDNIEHVLLFGGSRVLAEFAHQTIQQGHYRVTVFSCERQLEEALYEDGRTLGQVLTVHDIPFVSAPDINTDATLLGLDIESAVGIGLGEAWQFSPELIERFAGRLLDLMGTRLPQYLGGAHYTWQILRKNRLGCCNLQVINEDTLQSVFAPGEIVKRREYFFPASARIPYDYFDAAVENEVAFLHDFLEDVREGRDFNLAPLQEDFSLYFPRLHTLTHGFVNWDWNTEDIEQFICAFDAPYAGASTFLDGQRVHVGQCYSEYNDGPFHPFQSGLIYRLGSHAAFVASKTGTLVIKRVVDGEGKDLLPQLRVGQRFFTPAERLERALSFSAVYTEQGLEK
jgi:methionyl-tRNA formyltransferase